MAELSAAGGHPRPTSGLELYAWLFMRVSGVALLFLVLGHLAIMHLIHNVDEIDFSFVVARFENPLWRMYDWFLLMLALVHGMNGLRVVVDDYLQRSGWRVLALVGLYALTLVCFTAGTYVVLAWHPGS